MHPVTAMERLVTSAMEAGGAPTFADLDDDAVVERLRSAASRIAAATCDYLLLVAELVARGIWAQQGGRTPAHWLSWAIGTGGSTAREHVRVALALRDWPGVVERFAAGRISYSKVRAITRCGHPELEATLLELAEHATGAQLERIITDLEGVEERIRRRQTDPHDLRRLRIDHRDDGTSRITVELPYDVAAVVERQLAAFAEALPARIPVGVPDDPDDDPPAGDAPDNDAPAGDAPTGDAPTAWVPFEARLADAFVAACDQLTVDRGPDVSGADRHLLVLHVTPDDLADRDDVVDVRAGRHGAARPRAMCRSTLRRLACDARFSITTDDAPSVSGTTRRVPPRLRRLLLARDRACRFPSCGAERGLDAHHILHVADGGPTTPENLVMLCRFHHRFVHTKGWTILTDGAGRFRFAPPRCAPVPSAGALPGASAEAPDDHGPAGDPRALRTRHAVARPDYHQINGALVAEIERLRAPDPVPIAA